MSEIRGERWAAFTAFLVPLATALAVVALAAFMPELAWLKPGHASPLHGRDVTSENWNARFSLTDSADRRVSLADLRGKVVLLTFGYTHCPDACPTALARLAEVRRLMGNEAGRVQVLFVTVDPERDTGPFLGRYVRAFDPTFIGLRGTDEETDAAATALHADYEIMKYQQEIFVSHTVDTYLIDPNGHVRAVLPPSLSAREIVEDLRTLLVAKVGGELSGARLSALAGRKPAAAGPAAGRSSIAPPLT